MFGDASQLGHVGLEKSNAERQVDAHDPELGATQEMAIGGICEQNLHQVDVQEKGRCDGNLQVADPDERRSSVPDETNDAADESSCPGDSKACVQLSCALSEWCSTCMRWFGWPLPRSSQLTNEPQFRPRGLICITARDVLPLKVGTWWVSLGQ